MNEVVITGIARTPLGGKLGKLRHLSAPELGAIAVKRVLERAEVPPRQVEEVLMGCVLSAGVGMAPARQVALLAGLGGGVPCVTVNKVCGSGMKAVMLGTEAIQIGRLKTVIAGGMESMSNAPHLASNVRTDDNAADDVPLRDHIFVDGLEAPCSGELMGAQAQSIADAKHLTRAELDEFAVGSLQRAQKASADGTLTDEIAPIEDAHGTVKADELPTKFSADKIPRLKPAFAPSGTITAATASSIADGAAVLVLQNATDVADKNALPRIVAQATVATEPRYFTHAPVAVIEKVLKSTGWKAQEVDLYEINEAFASVPLFAIKELNIARAKVNVHGGACALGHPLGCSGARIVVSLVNAMRRYNAKRGVAAICIGGGEATALAISIG